MKKEKLINDIKDILKKTNDDNYYNTEFKNKIIELVKIIARENNIKIKITIKNKEKFKNKYMNSNKYIYIYI